MAVPVATTKQSIELIAAPEDKRTLRSTVAVNLRAMMRHLVEIYTTPEVAVVREYVANAVDATVAAASDVPVEVSIPTALDPVLIVSDRGIGMTQAELEAHFLSFMNSTKTTSNDQIGEYGTGAKSAWMIADSFLVTTVKNGRTTTVRATSRVGDDGELAHDIEVDDLPTDAPDGTTVTIPVNPEAVNWETVVLRVAAAHRPGMVRVDGKPAPSIHDRDGWIGPVLPGGAESVTGLPLAIEAGGTLFGVPGDLARWIRDNGVYVSGAVISLPIGSFEKTAARDFVVDTAPTRAAVSAALAEYQREVRSHQDRLDALLAVDPTAAVALRAQVLGSLAHHHSLLPMKAQVHMGPDLGIKWRRRPEGATRSSSWTPVTGSREGLLNFLSSFAAKLVVVTDVPAGRVLRNVGHYMDAEAGDARYVLPIPAGSAGVDFPLWDRTDGASVLVSPATPGVTAVSFADFDAEGKRLAALARTAAPAAGSRNLDYPVRVSTGGEVTEEQMSLADIAALAVKGHKVFADSDMRGRYFAWDSLPVGTDYVYVGLGARKLSVVRKAIPGVITEISAELYTYRKAELDALDADVLLALALEDDDARRLTAEVAHRVHTSTFPADPAHALTRKLARVYGLMAGLSEVPNIERIRSLASGGGSGRSAEARNAIVELATALTRHYPMLGVAATMDSVPRYYRTTDWTGDAERVEHLTAYLRHTPPVGGSV